MYFIGKIKLCADISCCDLAATKHSKKNEISVCRIDYLLCDIIMPPHQNDATRPDERQIKYLWIQWLKWPQAMLWSFPEMDWCETERGVLWAALPMDSKSVNSTFAKCAQIQWFLLTKIALDYQLESKNMKYNILFNAWNVNVNRQKTLPKCVYKIKMKLWIVDINICWMDYESLDCKKNTNVWESAAQSKMIAWKSNVIRKKRCKQIFI